jgi:hypothetical protein
MDYFGLLFVYADPHVPRTGKLKARGWFSVRGAARMFLHPALAPDDS